MPSLSSLIVQRQVATIAEVEQAISRQVIHGGDLVTNLLEVSPGCEHALTRVLAESLGIPCVPPGRLPAPSNDVLDLVPVETALRFAVFPLRLAQKTLVLAASERLKPSVEHDLAYMLGLDISQVASPLIRIREGIAAHYGIPLEPRQLRLVQRLDGRAESPSVRPPRVAAMADGFGNLPSNLSSGVSSPPGPPDDDAPPTRRKTSTQSFEPVDAPEMARSVAPSEAPSRDTIDEAESLLSGDGEPSDGKSVAFPESEKPLSEPVFEEEPLPGPATLPPEAGADDYGVVLAEPEAPDSDKPPTDLEATFDPATAARALGEGALLVARASDAGTAEARAEASASVAPFEPEAPEGEVDQPSHAQRLGPEPDPELLAEGPVAHDSPRPPGMVDRRAVANLLRREIGQKRRVAKTARKKGPFSRVDAERELEAARSPEDVLDTFFAFGSQFFEYSALFVIHGDLAEGRDAWGPGADHLRVLGLGVPLDLPSSLATVKRDGNVLLSRFDDFDLDRELVRDLDRARGRAVLAALVPLTVRLRTVAILYGDDAGSDVTLGSLGDLLGFSALASAQLSRVALSKKTKKGPFAGIVAPRAQPSSVAALARAFSLPGADALARDSAPAARNSSAAPAAGPTDAQSTRQATISGIGERSETPSSGTPAHLEPRVSPGATSVHPPRPAASYELLVDSAALAAPAPARFDPMPEREPAIEPGRVADEAVDPALAETAIASAALVQRRAETEGYDQARPLWGAEPPAVAPWSADARSVAAASEPPERSSVPPPLAGEGQSLDERVLLVDDAVSGLSSPRPGFVKPIPRVDEEDASSLVAEHVDDWQESPRPSGLRHDVEPESHDGRLGSYHLVPRPAAIRHRSEATDIDQLLERGLAGGLEGEEALSELLRRSEHEFPRLVERFPGPLVVDRLRARADLPPASECGPLLKALAMASRAALPFMTVRSSSADVEQRFWATHLLGELMFPEASNAVLPRLFDDDVSVRRVARRAAQALATAGAPGEPLKHSLEHTMRSDEEPMQRRLLAIEALSEIRVPSVVPLLIGGLRERSEGVCEASRTALMVVTRQDLGRLPDVWTAWWELHRGENRIEWLIQALTHDTASIRRAAGDELKLITREYFGYYDDLPPRERERAQARYFEWWRDDGQYRFR